MKPKKTILCVDDNEQSLSIRKILLETRGYRVLACNNGQLALEMFRRGGIDLVITDLIMPGLDGSHLIEEIKKKCTADSNRPHLRPRQNIRARDACGCLSTKGNVRACGVARTHSPLARAQARPKTFF